MKRATPKAHKPKTPVQICTCDRRWLTESQVAKRLNISAKFLQTDRQRGALIPYSKFGFAVRYSLTEIENFERKSMRSSTSDSGPKPSGNGK